ncbi:MAG: transposase family protein, partial [Pseudonocardiaceae bacterium]
KKPGAPRAESDIEFNTALAKIRVGAEWGIGHIKNWRILTSRYRGNLSRIDTVIQAVTGLQIINEHLSGRRLTFARLAA